MREESGNYIMDLWVMPHKGQLFTRQRPTDDTTGKSNGVVGEGDGVTLNVGSGRDEEGSSSEEESDEEMVADAQEGEHVEPSAVAEDEPDRDQEDLHGDEEAPARNVWNPQKPTTRGKRSTLQERTFYHTGHGVQCA